MAALAALAVGACSGPPDPAADPTAAPGGGSSACARVVAAVPAAVLGGSRVAAGSSPDGVAVWGSPGILLRCGLDPLGPTSLPCLSVDDVDWVLDDPGQGSDSPVVFTTYGREPAVEVVVPASYGRENATGALVDLGPAVSVLPATRACVDADGS